MADNDETSKEPFVPQDDRPEVRLKADTPLSELRVRDLATLMAQFGQTRKDFWDGKDWIKDDFDGNGGTKSKEIKEVKEFKESGEKHLIKDRKEIFEGGDVKRVAREGDIDVFDDFRIRGGGIRAGGGPQTGESSTLDARLAALEDSVAALAHFIGAELRPDLGSGALNREPDLFDQAATAKDQKDMKDKETLAEG